MKEEEKETSDQTDEDSPDKEKLEKEIELLEADVKNRKIVEKSAKYSIFLSQLLLGGKIKTLSVPKRQ